MSDNLDFYRRLMVRPPGLYALRVGVVVLAVVLGSISAFVLFRSFGISADLSGAAIAVLFFYLLPAVVTAEVISRLAAITKQWTYLMVILSEGAIFLFALIIPFADSSVEAWQIMWLGLATVYLIDLTMVVLAKGKRRFHMNLVYPLIYPGILIVVFHLFIGRLIGIQKVTYLQNSVLFLVSAFLLTLTIGFFEFLMRANIRGMSALDFFSTIILDEERSLDQGVETDVTHQALHIGNGQHLSFNIPWLHPGPVEGFGGGRLTTELIDADTFFLHVPSYHTLDLADPDDIDQFRNLPDAEMHAEATPLITLEHAGFTLRGRRYGGRTVVYLENRQVDDYDPAIIYDIKDRYPDICLIDLHNQPIASGARSLQRLEKTADRLKEGIDRLVEQLEAADMHPYRAGHAGNGEYRCLVEEVDDQVTCLLGIDGNGAPPSLLAFEDCAEFDETLVFTTDSHRNLMDLARPRSYDTEELLTAAREARENLSEATAGIGERVVEDVKVLGKSYEGLISTLNIMGRLVPIAIVLYYIGLVFLVF